MNSPISHRPPAQCSCSTGSCRRQSSTRALGNSPKPRGSFCLVYKFLPFSPASRVRPRPPATEARSLTVAGVCLPASSPAWRLCSHGFAGTYACVVPQGPSAPPLTGGALGTSQDGGDITGWCHGRVTEPMALRDERAPGAVGPDGAHPGFCYRLTAAALVSPSPGAPVCPPRACSTSGIWRRAGAAGPPGSILYCSFIFSFKL